MGKFRYGQNSNFRVKFDKNNVFIAPESLYNKSMTIQCANTPPAPKLLFLCMPKRKLSHSFFMCNLSVIHLVVLLCYEQITQLRITYIEFACNKNKFGNIAYHHLWTNVVNSFITICKPTLPRHCYGMKTHCIEINCY